MSEQVAKALDDSQRVGYTPGTLSPSNQKPKSASTIDIRCRKIVIVQNQEFKSLQLLPPPCSQMANFTDLFSMSTSFVATSHSTVVSLDAVPPMPRRLRSWRLALASRVSLAFHSFNCCLLFCDRAYAIAGVGLNPIPFNPVPSSSGSVDGSAR